jgi:hypothetical protein
MLDKASTMGAAAADEEVKMAACWPFQESRAAEITSEISEKLKRVRDGTGTVGGEDEGYKQGEFRKVGEG